MAHIDISTSITLGWGRRVRMGKHCSTNVTIQTMGAPEAGNKHAGRRLTKRRNKRYKLLFIQITE
jgi:hypothetical protein